VRHLVILLIRLYQLALSPFFGRVCRFEPSCSRYAIEVVEHFGVLRGSVLAVKRIGRCHPWNPGGYDPPPLPGAARAMQESK
jgi:putative membrane protein insertion efficiency factor